MALVTHLLLATGTTALRDNKKQSTAGDDQNWEEDGGENKH